MHMHPTQTVYVYPNMRYGYHAFPNLGLHPYGIPNSQLARDVVGLGRLGNLHARMATSFHGRGVRV